MNEINNYNKNRDDDVTLFAETNYRNKNIRFGIRRRDRRSHCFVLGKTGTGKSTLLENLIMSDMQNGEGLALFDPHGDLVQKILNKIPEHRKNDVILFDPSQLQNPIGFNVLAHKEGTHPHLIASGLISVFKKIWKDSWGPRLEYILRNTILALLELPGATLADIPRVLIDKPFRASLVTSLMDEQVKNFWFKEYELYPPHFRAEAIAPIQNKVGQFLNNKFIRAMVSQQQSSFDLRVVMDEGKILLADLSKGRIGEDACSLLGALLLTEIEICALQRTDTPENSRRDFYIYLDEFWNFTTASFASVLAESRKYHTNYMLVTQYLDQIDEELRSAIFGNVGTIITFRIGAIDSEYMAKEFYPDVDQQSFINLSNHYIYLKMMINGATSKAFSAVTLPPQ